VKKNIFRHLIAVFVVMLFVMAAALPVYAQGIDLEQSEGFFLSGLDYESGIMTEYYTDSASGTVYVLSQEDGLLYPTQENPRYTYHGYTMTDEKYAIDFFIDVTDGKLYTIGEDGTLQFTDQTPQVSYDDVLEYVQGSSNVVDAGGQTTEEFLQNEGYDKYEPEYYCFDPEIGLAFYIDENGVFYHINEDTGDYYEAQGEPSASAQFTEEESHKSTDETATEEICNVRVLEIVSDQTKSDGYDGLSRTQLLKVKVLDGRYEGRTLVMKYEMSNTMGNGAISEPAVVGDKLIGYFTEDEATGEISGIVTDYARTEKLILLAVIFVILLLLMGGMKGMRSLLALVITCLACIFIMIPAIISGLNPIVAAILAGIVAIAVTLIIVYGFTMKTLAAAVGAFAGVLVAGVLTAIMNKAMNMTGIVDCDSIDLAIINLPSLDLSDVLFATIVISALGGTIDVGISIASALAELKEKAPKIKGAELFKSGINIGIDIMGASLNTLILSYVGGSLTVLLIVTYYSSLNNMTTLMNDEMIASELLQALVGSMGLLCTVPITSLVAALMMCGKGNFGKLTLDCFPPVEKFCGFIKKSYGSIKGKISEISAENAKLEEPENLYEAAVRRSRELYRNAAEDASGDDDGFDDMENEK